MLVRVHCVHSKLRPDSERQWPILGLYLLGLLAHNHLSDFHTELELITPQNQKRLYSTTHTHALSLSPSTSLIIV